MLSDIIFLARCYATGLLPTDIPPPTALARLTRLAQRPKAAEFYWKTDKKHRKAVVAHLAERALILRDTKSNSY